MIRDHPPNPLKTPSPRPRAATPSPKTPDARPRPRGHDQNEPPTAAGARTASRTPATPAPRLVTDSRPWTGQNPAESLTSTLSRLTPAHYEPPPRSTIFFFYLFSTSKNHPRNLNNHP